jgi:hypothetical protein
MHFEDERYQPDYDEEERQAARQANFNAARGRARALLKKHKVAGPPVDVDSIAKECGLTVKRAALPGTLSGELYAEVREVFVNTLGRALVRQRFTVAHELGHWELGHWRKEHHLSPDNEGFEGGFATGSGLDGKTPIEAEANAFAAELLMPSEWLRKLRKPLPPGKPDVLAEEYMVSREAMFYQLMRSKLI